MSLKAKKILNALLFPPLIIRIILIPIATVFLICSMVFIGTEEIITIISYVVAAYTLTVWCIKAPDIIRFFKGFKDNRYARLWLDNERLRILVTLYGSLSLNSLYAIFQLGLGVFHNSFWFYSMAGYYIFLALMRLFLVRYTAKNTAGENLYAELKKYRACGIVFLLMNISLTTMIFFMVYFGRSFVHHEITTIALAAYTFTSLSIAIVSLIKYRKYESPIYSASKIVGLAAAAVSMLTLEATMLTTFGGTNETMRRVFLTSSGGVVSIFIVAMAVYMIVTSTKKIKLIKDSEKDEQ